MKERKPDDGGAPFSLPVIGLHMPARNVSMAQFADILQTIIPLTDADREDLPVLDQTGLSGPSTSISHGRAMRHYPDEADQSNQPPLPISSPRSRSSLD